jgi:hypothetical protein
MKKKKIIGLLFAFAAILTASFLVMDWLVFYRCGAVERCLMEGSGYQDVAKFATTALMTIVVLIIGRSGLCTRDRTLLQAGFLVSLCADFCIRIIHGNLLGVCFFMIVQTLYIIRHTRKSDVDNHFPKILYIPFGTVLLMALFCWVGTFEKLMLPIVASYGVFVVCSVVAACRTPGIGYFPAVNARCVKWGMVLFLCCDVCVGLSGLVSVDHSVQEIVAAVAHNCVWTFYVPALALLGLSGYRQDA